MDTKKVLITLGVVAGVSLLVWGITKYFDSDRPGAIKVEDEKPDKPVKGLDGITPITPATPAGIVNPTRPGAIMTVATKTETAIGGRPNATKVE